MSGFLSNILPAAGAAAGGYAQGHVQKQQMDQQRQTGDAQRLLMALQAAAAQRQSAPASPDFLNAMQANGAQGFDPMEGGTQDENTQLYGMFAQDQARQQSQKRQADLDVTRARLGVDKADAATARQGQKDSQWQADYDLKKRQVGVQEKALKLNIIRAMKVTDPKVIRFMNRGPNERKLVEEANQNGMMGDLFAELYNRGKWDPDEGGDMMPADDDEPPMPTLAPATKR